MQVRVPGILPALVDETLGRAALVLHKAIAIEVAVFINPLQGLVCGGQHLAHKLVVGGPVEGLAQQDQKQRSGVDGAVVRPERHFAAARHFAFAVFVQNFARVLVAPVVHLAALVAGEHAQGVDCKRRIERQRLVGGKDRISSENGGEPRNAGGDDVLVSLGNAERVKIADGGVQRGIELVVAALELRGAILKVAKRFPSLLQIVAEAEILDASRITLHQRRHGDFRVELLERLKTQIPARRLLLNGVRLG